MRFSITGHLGSGKSTICKLLSNEYNFDIVSAGSIMREEASRKGVSVLEFQKNPKYFTDGIDNYIDNAIVEKNKLIPEEKNVIFDSRLAWHFLPETFKIFIIVSPYEAALRTYLTRNEKEEKYSSIEEAMDKLIDRRVTENRRYKAIYNVNCEDLENYDVVVDTTFISPNEAVEIIMDCYNKKIRNEHYERLWISPQFLLPTGKLEYIDHEKIKHYCDLIDSNEPIEPIKILRVHDSLFVVEGHSRLIAYNLRKIKLINPKIVYDEDDLLSDGRKAKRMISVTENDVREWEKINGFKYNYMPRIVKKNDIK